MKLPGIHASYQIIETYREGEKVKQRVLLNLGEFSSVKAALDYWSRVLKDKIVDSGAIKARKRVRKVLAFQEKYGEEGPHISPPNKAKKKVILREYRKCLRMLEAYDFADHNLSKWLKSEREELEEMYQRRQRWLNQRIRELETELGEGPQRMCSDKKSNISKFDTTESIEAELSP